MDQRLQKVSSKSWVIILELNAQQYLYSPVSFFYQKNQ